MEEMLSEVMHIQACFSTPGNSSGLGQSPVKLSQEMFPWVTFKRAARMWVQRGRARCTSGHEACSRQSGCWSVPPAKHRELGGLRPASTDCALLPSSWHSLPAGHLGTREPTTKIHLSHSCYIYKKITIILCYSRWFACCKTIVINQKPISAAILKFALPGVVMFQSFFFFLLHFFFLKNKKNKKIKPVQSHLNVTSSHRQHSSSPSQEKRQIPLKAKAQRCSSLPLNWPVTVMWAMIFLQFYVICITQLKHQPEPWKMLLGHIYLAQPLLFCYALSTDQSHNRDFLVIL